EFWRRARWSPDGSHLLAQTESHHLDLFKLSSSSDSDAAASSSSSPHSLRHILRLPSPTPLLDYTWYPFAHPSHPATWCFAYSARDVPLRLVDAYTGATRATYGIQDHVERFIGPQAVAFTLDGMSLLAGHGGSISIFDVTRPGVNTCTTLRLVPMKRAVGAELQRGLVSALTIVPHYDGSGSELIAVATFSGTVGIYQRGGGAPPGLWVDSARQPTVSSSLCIAGWKEGEGAGVMQLAFHPTTPYLLFVALRKSGSIKCFDLRYLSPAPDFTSSEPADAALVAIYDREGVEGPDGEDEDDYEWTRATSQRLFFHIDWAGRWLCAGSTTGRVSVWSLTASGDDEGNQGAGQHAASRRSQAQLRPRARRASWKLAGDAIASVSLHPLLPLVVAASGSRRWPDEGIEDEDHSSSDESAKRTGTAGAPRWLAHDAGLSLWDISE
ncbi:hypothetical protein BDZ90DRAFT_207028, partial [Jaminaea rosea]